LEGRATGRGQPATLLAASTSKFCRPTLVLALPLYVTLVVAWIDRRLEGRLRCPDRETTTEISVRRA
jgi:hypothetical protein